MGKYKIQLLIFCLHVPLLVFSSHFSGGFTTSKFPEVRIYISKSQLAELKTDNSIKYVLVNPLLLVNGDSARVKEIHARGNNSLKFQRKSLSVELDKAIKLHTSDTALKLKKFNLISLSMDKYLWHNRWANLILESIGLFPLFNTYCTVWINDEPQGIYLLIEKPQHYRTESGSPYMLRRGLNHEITDEYFEKEKRDAAKYYRKQYNKIYSLLSEKNSTNLTEQLNEQINLTSYYHWMAFNFLTSNGDYSDEVYFIINPNTSKFEIIPWDFDDLLRFAPHEGNAARKRIHEDKKIFSLEDDLDHGVANHPELYDEYEKTLRNLLQVLDSATLTRHSLAVINELEILSQNPDIVDASLFLDKQPFEYNAAKGDILMSLDLILKRRKWILQEIK